MIPLGQGSLATLGFFNDSSAQKGPSRAGGGGDVVDKEMLEPSFEEKHSLLVPSASPPELFHMPMNVSVTRISQLVKMSDTV